MDKLFISSGPGFKKESIQQVKAIAFDIISEDIDLWGLSDEQAQQTCAYIDGVMEYARKLIEAIEAAKE